MTSNFDKAQFAAELRTLPFPTAHLQFLQPQTAPYLIYRDDEFDIVAANSSNVHQRTFVTLELYAKAQQIDTAESCVEQLLETSTTFEKTRSFIEEDGLYVTYYSFYV